MEWFGQLWRRLFILFRFRRFNQDLEEEMRFHLELQTQENLEEGMDPVEARYTAMRHFGNPDLLREESRRPLGLECGGGLGQRRQAGLPDDAAESRVYGGGAAYPGARDWGEYGCVQLDLRFAAALITGAPSRATPIFTRSLAKMLRQTPGVLATSVAMVPSDTPLYAVEVEGRRPEPGENTGSQMRDVTDGAFETLRTPLLQGRAIERRDCSGTNAMVAVINRSFARKFFPNVNPLGRHVIVFFGDVGAGPKVGPFEIVGVVADARYTSPRKEPLPEIFTPYHEFWGARLLVRTFSAPHAFIPTLHRLIQREEPGLRIFSTDTLEDATDKILNQERMLASLSGFFGLLALTLAALGIFGVLSDTVVRRIPEIGIRMALGAQRRSVLWMVVRDTLAMLAAGLGIGIPLAFLEDRLISSQLFELPPADPVALAFAVLGLTGAALLAGYLPAWRATRVDPMIALRCE